MLIGLFRQRQFANERKWLFVSADVRGAGTRDEPLRTSAWEARMSVESTEWLFSPLFPGQIGILHSFNPLTPEFFTKFCYKLTWTEKMANKSLNIHPNHT